MMKTKEPTLQRRDGPESSSLSDQIYQILSEQIISGHIQYGDRLNIKDIATELNVSPMPIRDALKRLEMEKIVIIKPRSTCYVRVPTKRMTLDAIDARRMLEIFAIREAVPRVNGEDLAGLKVILGDMDTLIRRNSGGRPRAVIDEYIALDHCFHTELCSLSRNEYVTRFYRETSMHLNMTFRYGIGVCHGLEATYGDHRDIYDYLSRNSEKAIEVLETHLQQSRTNILNEPTFQLLDE